MPMTMLSIRQDKGVPTSGRICLALSLLLFLWGGIYAWRQIIINRWPEVQARVLAYERHEVESRQEPLFDSPIIEYEYCYEGQSYRTDRLMPSPAGLLIEGEWQIKGYQLEPGMTVICAVNPRHHAEAYIKNHGLTFGTWTVFVLAFVFLLAALNIARNKP